jgi:hypothetical protein
MWKVIQLALAGMMGLALAACGQIQIGPGAALQGSGNITTQQHQVSDFARIDMSGVGDVVITQGEAASLTVEADDNLQAALQSEIRDGTLYLSVAPNTTIRQATRITFVVTVRELSAIRLSGAGTITARDIRGEQLVVHHSGVGSITVGGVVRAQDVTVSGLGSYDGTELVSERATIDLSGIGGAVVQVREQLNATVSGIGNVEYLGSPEVHQQLSGGGAVSQRAP